MRGWNKPCELEDFSDPELLETLREVFPQERDHSLTWPSGVEYRKHWEVAMAIRAAKSFLPADRRKFALGIGAGTEATTFYLTNYFRWVFATDLYAADGWPFDSPRDMLQAPESFANGTPLQRRHLVVQHMDARNLVHEDSTFDFIYSCSSIEHFGSREEIKQASAEMGRVLKSGGIIAISTEYCVYGQPGYLEHDTLLPGQDDIHELIVAPSGCTPVDDLSFQISAATLSRPVNYREAIQDHVRRQRVPGTAWSQYPHILLEDDGRAWTSYHLTMRKGGAA